MHIKRIPQLQCASCSHTTKARTSNELRAFWCVCMCFDRAHNETIKNTTFPTGEPCLETGPRSGLVGGRILRDPVCVERRHGLFLCLLWAPAAKRLQPLRLVSMHDHGCHAVDRLQARCRLGWGDVHWRSACRAVRSHPASSTNFAWRDDSDALGGLDAPQIFGDRPVLLRLCFAADCLPPPRRCNSKTVALGDVPGAAKNCACFSELLNVSNNQQNNSSRQLSQISTRTPTHAPANTHLYVQACS